MVRLTSLREALSFAVYTSLVVLPSGCHTTSAAMFSASATGQATPEPPEQRVPAEPTLAAPAVRSTRALPRINEPQPLSVRYAAAPALARFRGEVSYYSDALAGRPTASGEPYEPRKMSAAHRSLPFGTVVRVRREDSGHSVYVRINDRGPFVRGRVIDVSRSAAEALNLLRKGVAKVTVEVVAYGAGRKGSGRKRRNRH